MEELVAGARAEPGTLGYEWYLSEDGGTVHVYERYANSEATIAHNAAFAERFADRFVAAVEPTRFTVYGDPSPAAREILDGFGATYLAAWGGFSR
jgi:quinol monooxygenase YgiN